MCFGPQCLSGLEKNINFLKNNKFSNFGVDHLVPLSLYHYFLIAYYVPDMVPGAADTVVRKLPSPHSPGVP